MFYDDNYNPTDPNDYDVNVNETDANGKNKLGQFKQLNRRYHQINRNITKNNGKQQLVTIGLYSSGNIGSYIKNAETGESYNYKVGSKDEDLFFKVSHSTGEFKSGPLTLFYETPEHFERHQLVTLDNNIIQSWNRRQPV